MQDGTCDVSLVSGCSSSLRGCAVVLHGAAGSGKVTVVSAASRRLNLHLLKVRWPPSRPSHLLQVTGRCSFVQVDCVSVCADSPAATEAKLAAAFQRAAAVQPCVLLLRNLQLLLRPKGAEEDGRVEAALCQLLHSAPTRWVSCCPLQQQQQLVSS